MHVAPLNIMKKY